MNWSQCDTWFLNLIDLLSTHTLFISLIYTQNLSFIPYELLWSCLYYWECVCVRMLCVWRGCIITVLFVFNNAGGAVGTQLGNLDLSINISQRSRYIKSCMSRVCASVCLWVCCVGGRLPVCVGTYFIQICKFVFYNVSSPNELPDSSTCVL